MKKTLYLKFLLAYAIFGFFGFFIVSAIVPGLFKTYLVNERSKELYANATHISDTIATELYASETSLESVKEELDSISEYLDCRIRIINPSGRLVVDSSEPLDVEKIIVIDDFDAAIIRDSYYIEGDFFHQFTEPMLSVMAPIVHDYNIKGYVAVHYPMSRVDTSSRSIQNICYLVLAILLMLSLIILIFFTMIVYSPLKKITYATEQYASGNMHYEFQVESNDEIGYLAACLNYMASEIARAEDDQKKFVANVSHDFRSPLTSIRGFLEAMIDGTIPPEMHEKYLKVVLNETDRLTKLTNGLLTLNNLNTKGMLLDRTNFDINRVIRNTAASFEGICRNRSIVFKLLLTGDTMYVNADLEKIQQVLYNLIDNAIKFSPNDSAIKLETTLRKSKVFVSVRDSGVGIPKDDLKMIWERFYKSDSSRGKDKKGTGLGLSIVKEIINSHNEHINVISTQGEGSEFIFTLPVADIDEDEE